MKNALLYLSTVLIWGSTWLAIEFQLGEAPVFVSLVYRFAIAAVVMWLYCLWAGVPMAFSRRNHLFIALLACSNFSMNYALLYYSQTFLSSAMTSIAFSTMLLMNIVNTRIFFGSHISARVYIGALFGILGIAALFWNDIGAIEASGASILGLGLVLSGAFVASLGNMVSVRNSKAGMNVFAVNAWGMLYGTLILIFIVLVSGDQFSIPSEPSYLISLLYLGVFGTVIAFATYYVLLNNMGPEKASYVIVLFPVVAVILSTLFEGFSWTSNTFAGFTLVLIGNAIVLTPYEKIRNYFTKEQLGPVKN
jgi:drug/metabolite transporter (DMT)-like permease